MTATKMLNFVIFHQFIGTFLSLTCLDTESSTSCLLGWFLIQHADIAHSSLQHYINFLDTATDKFSPGNSLALCKGGQTVAYDRYRLYFTLFLR